MRNSPMIEVFLKELREMMRDKRVRSAAFILPIFIVMLMMSMFGIIGKSVGRTERQRLRVVNTNNELVKQLESKFDISYVDSVDAAKKLVSEGKAPLVVEFEPDQPVGRAEEIRFYFDAKEERGQLLKARAIEALAPVVQGRIAANLALAQVDPKLLKPVDFQEKPIQVGDKGGASGIIVSFLPYLIVLFAFTGGFAIASELVAGEKEKNTLETLLITPVARTQIVLGKFLALSVVCFMSSISGTLGIVLAKVARLPGGELMFESGIGLNPKSIGTIIILLLPLVALFASLLLAVSSYAKNTREAQTYLSLLNLVVIVPAVFSQIIGLTEFGSSIWVNAVPILNTATGIRNALQGKAAFLPVTITVGVSLLIAGLGLALAIKLFNREQVLVRV